MTTTECLDVYTATYVPHRRAWPLPIRHNIALTAGSSNIEFEMTVSLRLVE